MNNTPKILSKAAEENIVKLKAKLRQLFQLDRGDLDFGLYRIMALKSTEVSAFLDNELLPQVTGLLGDIANSDTSLLQKNIEDISQKAKDAGFDPKESPKVKELNTLIKSAKSDQQTEADTYNHLYNFFSRYYDEGDFMSLRRYKGAGKEAYSIPYNGEEVKLHWANADQYYIKTTENYASYVFIVDKEGKESRVRFEIADADNEKDNIKETNGNQRLFVLAKDFVAFDENQLTIRFDHRPLTEGEKKKHPQNGNKRQHAINQETEQRILAKITKDQEAWLIPIFAPCPTEADENRTLLGKHITAYTAKNSFDYFIHKDLGSFLHRELDNYLKSEVISIDNLELTDDPTVFIRGLAQIKAIKNVGNKIIDFLAQLEGFQKQLWLKRKFVLETQYCVTLDKVPQSLYSEIAKNKSQRDEWVKLFAIDEINGDLAATAYSKPLKLKFLNENPYLVLDTRHFDKGFSDKLLAALSEAGAIEEQMSGLLVHGENFQALNLMQERYRGRVKCVYIDPPYNTDASAIMYKNGYKNSSWLSFMHDRLVWSKNILTRNGILCCAIDDEEVSLLRTLLQSVFTKEIGIAPVRSNPVGRKSTGQFSPTHEYALFYGQDESIPGVLQKTEKQISRYRFSDERGRYDWLTLIRQGSNDKREDAPKMFYPIYVGNNDAIRIPKMEWDESGREYKILETPKKDEVVVWPVRENGNGKIEKNWHRGWERVRLELSEYRVLRDDNGGINIQFKTYMDERAMPQTWWDKKEYASANHGAIITKELFGEMPFDFPKSVKLVEDCLRASGADSSDVNVIDYFAGSGTTGHAVINLNREDNGNRKYILVEVGHHFETVLLPRMKKVAYSKDWKGGKPKGREGISQLFKYIRLESYEDTLDSLTVKSRADLVDTAETKMFAEDYQLRYALGEETAESASLVGKDFIDPFNYTLSVVRDGIRRDVRADLVETFNFLLGLRLSARRQIENVLTITGTNSKDENCLILWRNLEKMNASKLDKWFLKHRKTFGDDLNCIYANGDHTLNMLRKPNEKWEAVTTELVFRELMFERAE
ncbi:site-specific DNA-methyltransferase [Candidatus Spongiihabitans sp.]|uniref:site-specific DNA-methyltransferase n=1 Tax=Candidatus Spongiihabitans sp. TaxID=3101308 RepID=UPI003C6EF52F